LVCAYVVAVGYTDCNRSWYDDELGDIWQMAIKWKYRAWRSDIVRLMLLE